MWKVLFADAEGRVGSFTVHIWLRLRILEDVDLLFVLDITAGRFLYFANSILEDKRDSKEYEKFSNINQRFIFIC